MNIDIDKVDFNMLIDSLPEDELEIFCLYYSPNMSYKKVGDIKGISATRVRQKLARGHRLIRKTLMLKAPEMYEHMLRTHKKRDDKAREQREQKRKEKLEKEGEKIHVYHHNEESWTNRAREILKLGHPSSLFAEDLIKKAMNGDIESINLCMERIAPVYNTNSIVYHHKDY